MVWLYWNAQFYSDEINDVTTSRDISTHDIFGKRLHTYTIKDAIGDGNVLGFDVTYFKPHWVVENAESDFSEQEYEKKSIKVMFTVVKSFKTFWTIGKPLADR